MKEHQFKPGKDERRWTKGAVPKDKLKDASKSLAVLQGGQPVVPERRNSQPYHCQKEYRMRLTIAMMVDSWVSVPVLVRLA